MIKDIVDEFVKAAQQKEFRLVYGNDYWAHIFADIINPVIPNTPFPKGNWKPVETTIAGITEKQMLKTAQKMCLVHAVQCLTSEVKDGTFDKLLTHRIIFLKEKDMQGNSLKLLGIRYPKGEILLTHHILHRDKSYYSDLISWRTKTKP